MRQNRMHTLFEKLAESIIVFLYTKNSKLNDTQAVLWSTLATSKHVFTNRFQLWHIHHMYRESQIGDTVSH